VFKVGLISTAKVVKSPRSVSPEVGKVVPSPNKLILNSRLSAYIVPVPVPPFLHKT